MKVFSTIYFSLLYNALIALANTSKDTFKLELVQVLFRHGDRTPMKAEIYKTDPYDPAYYKPYGYGQLTKTGMQREHKLGVMLRQRYNDFLGDYNVDDVYAYSTDYDRTKMSLQLVLNGLYPPTAKTCWSNNIKWFPIPTHYEPFETDFLFFDITGKCSEGYVKLLEEAQNLPEVVRKIEEYKDFFDYVRNKTQITSTRFITGFLIAMNIQSVVSLGLPLPDWCSKEDYKKLQEILTLTYDIMAYTTLIKKIAIGPTIERFLENVRTSDELENKKKLYLYSAHDINVAAFNRAHNFTGIPANPAYGSAVIIEKLRGPDDQIYLRMLYWTGVSEKLIALKLENCRYECLLSKYVDIISSVLPPSGYSKCKTSAYDNPEGNSRSIDVRIGHTGKINPDIVLPYLLAGEDLFSMKYGQELLF